MQLLSPDVVEAVHFYTNAYVAIASRFVGAKAIGAVRNDGLHDVGDAGPIGGRLSLYMPRFLAVNSKSALFYLKGRGLGGPKLLYLPNVVDLQTFSPANHSTGAGEIRLLMVGRLVRQKRFDVFLRLLFSLSNAGGPRIVGHIVGDGPDRESLRTLAGELGLKANQIYFHGTVSDVERLYQQMDVCLHLSDWEGLPNSVLEAMSCGLPVIASPVGGIPEIVQEGVSGFLVGADDEKGILRAITRLMNDTALRRYHGPAGQGVRWAQLLLGRTCLASRITLQHRAACITKRPPQSLQPFSHPWSMCKGRKHLARNSRH